jgi:predicted adenylyl cyclase CyaB
LNNNNLHAAEIEIKFQVEPAQLQALREKLDASGCFQKEAEHIETYLDNPDKTFNVINPDGGFIDAREFLRVRRTSKGDSVCLKIKHLHPETGKPWYVQEHETTIGNAAPMQQIFENLGFTNKTILEKTRRTYRMGDFEIVIDDMKALGIFLEVELKKEVSDVAAGLEMIKDFLKNELGLVKIKKIHFGYIHMKWNPDVEFGEWLELV